ASTWTPETYQRTTFVLSTFAFPEVRAVQALSTLVGINEGLIHLQEPGRRAQGLLEVAIEVLPVARSALLDLGKRQLKEIDRSINTGGTKFVIDGVRTLDRLGARELEGLGKVLGARDLIKDTVGDWRNLSGGSPREPAQVGGIYLRGAGEALKDLGRLRG